MRPEALVALAEVGRRRPAPPPFEATPVLSHTTTTFPNVICATGAVGRPLILGIEWDAENRLVAVNQGTHRSEFTYDGESRRVRIVEKENGSVTSDKRYLWCELEICEQRDGTGATVQRRFFTQGFQEGTSKYFYAKDHLGSIRDTTDNAGTLQLRLEFDPYGRPNAPVGTPTWSTFGYTGHLQHWDSGVIFAPYRGYLSAYGRWLSEDPIGRRGGPNYYAYVGNAPTNHLDPLGLARWRIPCSVPEIEKWKQECLSRNQRLQKITCWRVENAMIPGIGGKVSFSTSFGVCTSEPEKPCKPFDPKKKENQEDPDWKYRWHEADHEKRGGGPHWDRGNKYDGDKQQWSSDGNTWRDK